MNKTFLLQQLSAIENAKRINRLRVADLVFKNPILLKHLLEIVFEVENKISIKAAWTLELVCAEKINWLAPHLNYFTQHIFSLKFESAIRPASKICNFLAIAYTSKKDSEIKKTITKLNIESIIETGFDWMIGQHKVATKAYTMNALFLFGKNYDWVHEELKLILQQNIPKESAAYKARGRITLGLINKK